MRTHTIRWIALWLGVLLFAGCGSSSGTTGSTHPATPTPSIGTISATISGLGTLSDPSTEDYGIAADDTAVWVYNGESGDVIRIDPKTNKVVATVAIVKGCTPGLPCGSVAIGAGSVWVTAAGTVTRIDPATNQVVAQLDVSFNGGLECLTVVALAQAVWVEASDGTTTELERIDPATTTVSVSAQAPGTTWAGFAANERGVWGLDIYAGLIRFNPQTAQVAGHLALTGGAGIAVGAGSVWVAKDDGTLLRITPAA